MKNTKNFVIALFIFLAILILISSIKSQPKIEEVKTPEKPRVTHEWSEDELDRLNCEINKASCKPSKARKWTFTNFKHTPYYNDIVAWLKTHYTNWEYMAEIIAKESGFRPHAKNPVSSAYGLGQLIESNRTYGVGNTDIELQLREAKKYLLKRYGSESKALSFWESNKYW